MPYTLTKTENITETSYIGVRISFLPRSCILKLLNVLMLFLSDEARYHLGGETVFRSISSGADEIHVRYINIVPMKLRLESCV
jgi:hypothetical protein